MEGEPCTLCRDLRWLATDYHRCTSTHLLCRRALKCAMQVLDFLQGDGDLKKQLGDGWDQRCAFDHSS